VTSLLYFLPFILRFALVWAWNLILFILWIALFGIFGKVRSNTTLSTEATADESTPDVHQRRSRG
jgi:hypothetical protein